MSSNKSEHLTMIFKQTMDQITEKLKDIRDIDVIIGIPFYNEKETLKNVISVAKSSLKANRKLIVCVGDPAGEEALESIREHFGSEVVGFLMPLGVNGRGYSIRAILELARFFESDVILLEADLKSQEDQGIKPSWVDRMASPIFGDYDMAIACFRRHPFEDIIGNILVSPIISTLYQTKFNDPLSGVFAITHDLVEEFCSEFDQCRKPLGGYGINTWIITTALKWKKKICEIDLGAKMSPVSFGKKYIVIKEMLRVLFECIGRDEDLWLEDIKVIKTPDVFGSEYKDMPLEVVCNYTELFNSFTEGIWHYNNLLQKILNRRTLSHIELMLKHEKSMTYLMEIWSQVVYEFILAYSFNQDILKEDLLELFIAIYDGMTASFIKEIQDLRKCFKNEDIDVDTVIFAQSEAIFKNTVRAFMKHKPSLIKKWREKVDETSPVLTPLDYLEFIPGVPIVLPKKLRGMGNREIKTGQVFRRLQKRYNSAFKSFLKTLNIDSSAPSQEIGQCLSEFIDDLETTIDGLCPGDLYTVVGTINAVENIFRIIPHNKVWAVKWEILRKILYEYPPGNLILRMGFKSLRELLDSMDEREILTLASFTEDKDYFDRIFYWLRDNLRPDSFEEVELRPMVVNRNNFHSTGELREISDLNRLTARIPVMNLGKGMGGSYPNLRYFTRIAKSIVEAEHFSGLWKTYTRERKEVGRKFVNSILGHYGKAMFSAHHIFENWHHRVLVSKLQTIVETLRQQNKNGDAKKLETMAEGYGLSLILNDGTFIP
ncbi:MAG: hypothetical protein PHE70_04865 [Tepidanaerobacteraceae bacterium]|nr:hypothetical protein [Tepidanaerobacteraceae bacterium]